MRVLITVPANGDYLVNASRKGNSHKTKIFLSNVLHHGCGVTLKVLYVFPFLLLALLGTVCHHTGCCFQLCPLPRPDQCLLFRQRLTSTLHLIQ